MSLLLTGERNYLIQTNLSFNELNNDCRNSLIEYFLCNSEQELEENLKNRLFTFELLPVDVAKERCMKLSDDLWGCKTFSEYHKMYLDGGDVPNHGSSKWACIAPGDDEWLLDGWHRFHSYIQSEDSHIPLLTLENN